MRMMVNEHQPTWSVAAVSAPEDGASLVLPPADAEEAWTLCCSAQLEASLELRQWAEAGQRAAALDGFEAVPVPVAASIRGSIIEDLLASTLRTSEGLTRFKAPVQGRQARFTVPRRHIRTKHASGMERLVEISNLG